MYPRISSMSMQLLGGKQTHQVFRFEPDAFVPHRPPEKDERLGVEETAFMGQLIKFYGLSFRRE